MYQKRTLEELIDRSEPAWPMVQEWIAEAIHPVEVLPPAEGAGHSLVSLQVSTRSPLGAIVFGVVSAVEIVPLRIR